MIGPSNVGNPACMLVTLALSALLLHSVPEASHALAPPDAPTERFGHDRGYLAPSEVTLPARTMAIGLDEVVWLRMSVGVTEKLQLSLAGMAVPFPFAGGGLLPIRGLIGGGVAGVGAAGVVDVGVKYRLLDEGELRPGLAVSYDLVDAFVSAVGIAGGGAVGDGAAGVVAPGSVWVNAQLNVFSAVAGKHFGRVHLFGGAYVVDNHNVLPQSARVSALIFAGGTGGSGATGASNETEFDHLPTTVVPFLATEVQLTKNVSLIGEAFARAPLSQSFGTTGARWMFRDGKGVPRFRLDASALWMYFPPDHSDPNKPRPGMVLPEPWISFGWYVG